VFQAVFSGAYLLAQAESKLQNNRSLIEQDEPSTKSDRKEERRKKAAGGKGGGGTQVSKTVFCMMKCIYPGTTQHNNEQVKLSLYQAIETYRVVRH
jgi:hypothetical protein